MESPDQSVGRKHASLSARLPTLAIAGGTGALGGALAMRWAAAGYPVIVGSRSSERALEAAQALAASSGAALVRGMSNVAAAEAAHIVVIAVPFSGHDRILNEIRPAVGGKIVIDATVPLVPPKVATVQMPPEGCAAVAAQQRLGEDVKVVSAFQNVAAHKLRAGGPVECDVLVCGNDEEARQTVIGLTEAIGMRGLDAGPLANSVAAEALTSILIGINKRYKADGAGLRITGIGGNASRAVT